MALLKTSMWKRVVVKIKIKNRVVGGIPTDPALIAGWLSRGMPKVAEEERAKLAEKTLEELGDAADEKAEGMWTTFKKDEKGIYLEGRCVKAMFKESANVLRDLLTKEEMEMAKDAKKAAPAEEKEKKAKAKKAATAIDDAIDGEEVVGKKGKGKVKSRFTNLKARTAEKLFVEEDKVRFIREGKVIEKPDGDGEGEERAIHVMTAQGPRTALKRFDFVNEPEMEFTLRFLRDGTIDRELIECFLEYAQWNGLGSDRSQGQGMFTVLSVEDK